MKVLFICNQNENRSRTAEEIFEDRFETRSAGLFNEEPLKEEELDWADLIIVMEDYHRKEISERFPKQYMKKKILSLNIPDVYNYMDSKLVKELKESMNEINLATL